MIEPRLLAGGRIRCPMGLADHLRRHGSNPSGADTGLIELVAASGLRGRGGAGFPAAAKLAAVSRARGAAVVIVNGAEGEPASAKDTLLLATRPHLVLDGAELCAQAVGAHDVIVVVAGGATLRSVEPALAERAGGRVAFSAARVPDAFLAGEQTALISYLQGGAAIPTQTPPHPSERGLRRRPTLVANVETLAHIALIARHGPEWFRSVGAAGDPGSALVTLSGAVANPGVLEVASGTGLAELVHSVGGVTAPIAAALVGGYFGEWLDPAASGELRLDNGPPSPCAARRGAGVIALLPQTSCGPAETARVMAYLARHSAGQCGPCTNGLPSIAATLAGLVDGTAGPEAMSDLRRWESVIPGRGACRLPDGAVRFAGSALRVFAGEFADHHRYGRCERCAAPAVLPVPPAGRAEVAA